MVEVVVVVVAVVVIRSAQSFYLPGQHQAEFMFWMKRSQRGSRQMYRQFVKYYMEYLHQTQPNEDTICDYSINSSLIDQLLWLGTLMQQSNWSLLMILLLSDVTFFQGFSSTISEEATMKILQVYTLLRDLKILDF